MHYISSCDSPLGRLRLLSNGEAITGILFEEQKEPGIFPYKEKELAVFAETRRWLDIYFGGSDPGFLPPLFLYTTLFRKEVYEPLMETPFGTSITYGALAKECARRRKLPIVSARAVGNALAHNPIPLLIPCHRVLGKDGSLTGYAGGLERKRYLLDLEHISCRDMK